MGLIDMSNLGSSVRTDIKATNIAKPVKAPNIIVGIKFERIKIEKPKMTVTPVKNIALPIVE